MLTVQRLARIIISSLFIAAFAGSLQCRWNFYSTDAWVTWHRPADQDFWLRVTECAARFGLLTRRDLRRCHQGSSLRARL